MNNVKEADNRLGTFISAQREKPDIYLNCSMEMVRIGIHGIRSFKHVFGILMDSLSDVYPVTDDLPPRFYRSRGRQVLGIILLL